MKMKKIWLSYPLWLAFTAAAGIMLAVYLSAIGNLLWETDKYTIHLPVSMAGRMQHAGPGVRYMRDNSCQL